MIDIKTPLYTQFSGELNGLERYLDYGWGKLLGKEKELTLQKLHKFHPCCPAEVMAEGLAFLKEKSAEGRVVYSLYETNECADDERKKDVRLFYYPGDTSKPTILICAGGGYGYVCNVVEGFPVAMRFSRLGYPVLVLCYRVGRAPAVDLALEDLARAVKLSASGVFGRKEYVLCGFSAGGNLITQWATDNLGFSKYALPAPKALLAIYPAISGEKLFKDIRHRGFLKVMFGKIPDEEMTKKYDVSRHCDLFPPTYMAVGKQDPLISKKPLEEFRALLQAKGKLCKFDIFPRAPHGFGDGSATGAEGWIARADTFLKTL